MLLLNITATNLNAQTFEWAKQLGGTMEDNNKAVAIDANGNVYTCGRFNGAADFDPGAGTHYLTAGSSGAMFISKLTAAGDFVWAKHIDGNPDGLNLAVGMNGSVYITGNFKDVIDFDPDAGVFNLTTTSPGGSCQPHLDIFILKLNADGNFMWAGQIGGTGDDYAGSNYHKAGGGIALGANDALYVGGGIGRENNVNVISSPLVDYDPSLSSTYLTNNSACAFVVKLDSSGTFIWVNTSAYNEETSQGCSNISTTTCHAIALDNSENVYYTGKVQGWRAFVSKVSSTGASLWSATLSSNNFSVSYDVVVANGSVYTTGFFAGTADFDPSAAKFELKSLGGGSGPNQIPNQAYSDAFVWKLSSAGTYQWAGQLGGADLSVGRSIDLDANGNIYTTGYFTGTNVDFNPHKTQKYLLNATGGEDVYISKLTSAGNFVWAVKLGGTLNERAYGIEVDASGNIHSTGTFEGTVDFNPSSATANLTSTGVTDVYVHKMTQASLRMEEVSSAETTLLLYPNPASKVISFNTSDWVGTVKLQVVNALGQQVIAEDVMLNGEEVHTINVSSLTPGIYKLILLNDSELNEGSFVKE